MFCPNLSDPNIKAQFESLQSIVPEYAYYLWDKYQGEVPAKYYNLSNVLIDLPELNSSAVSSERTTNIFSNNSLFGIDVQNQGQLEFHVNTLNVVTQFLENIGVEQRLVPEFLSEQGSVVEGAIAAANFINGTVDIIDDLNKRPEAWNKLPEEAAHFWYRLLDSNSPLKDALLTASLTDRKEEELRNSLYGSVYNGPKVLGKLALDDDGNVTSKPALSAIREEAIGQLIAEAIKRIENKNANTADYSFFKKFLEWVNSVIKSFKNTTIDPFEVAAMKILSSDMSDLMTWAEYSKLNNIVNFADVLTEQSVAPIDYTLIEDIGVAADNVMYVEDNTIVLKYGFVFRNSDYKQKYNESSPAFSTQQELDNWVSTNVPEHNERQKAIIQEVRDNQAFFDRLLNKSFRKKSKFLPKTLRKYFNIVDSDNLYTLEPWNVSQELEKITKKLSDEEKEQLVRTNGYTNIAPTLKVLPNLLQKYKKNPIVLSETIKLDGAKKQELSILDGIRKMIKSENPNLKTITAEDFVQQVHEWLNFHYLLGFADESAYLSYRVDQTFTNVRDRSSDEDFELANMTEAEIQALPFAERQRIATILGLTKQNPDVYHNKVSLRFNDKYHLKSGHFNKSPSAWGNLTYFYTGKNKWKDRVLLHEIQNDNIEFLREYKSEKVNLETSLGRYLQDLNETLLGNIAQIESPNARVVTHFSGEFSTYKSLNALLDSLKEMRTDSQLTTFKQRIAESIELYKSDDSVYTRPEKAQKTVDESYAKKRKFADFKKRGGIRSLLNNEELVELKNVLSDLNNALSLEAEIFNIDTPVYAYNLKEKKAEFKRKTIDLTKKINSMFSDLYGEDAPLITLSVPAKRLSKNERYLRGTNEEKLNESVDSLLAFSEIQMDKYLSKDIWMAKRIYNMARNANTAYEFNLGLSKITANQFNTLMDNFKYNQSLLAQSVKEQSQKDLNSSQNAETKKAKSIIQYLEQNFDGKLGEFTVRYLNNNVYVTSVINERLYGLVSSDMWDIKKFLDYVKQVNPSLLDIDTSFLLFTEQQNTFTALKQKALDKKEELEKDYGKIEDEVKQTLDVELNYFTPLVHHLIQKHINQYGKDFPMYFSGFEITKLTQNNDRTALIYAGKDEINIVDKNEFTFNEVIFKQYQGERTVLSEEYDISVKELDKNTKGLYHNDLLIGKVSKGNNGLILEKDGIITQTNETQISPIIRKIKVDNVGIVSAKYEKFEGSIRTLISKQEYEKAYQQATERRAKEIKFEAILDIGILNSSEEGIDSEKSIKKLSDKELEEGIKKLNDYKKQSKQNLDRVVNTIMNISNSKPIETGAIYNAMTQISGVKLIWENKVEGLKGEPGGYKVDLTNYNYNTPVLYGLQTPQPPVSTNMPTTMFSRKDAKFVSNRFIRLERQYDFIRDIQNDPEYGKMSIPEKKSYVASKHFQEILPSIEGLNSVTVEGNRIYLSQTKRVKSSAELYNYALKLKENINAMFPLVSYNPPAYVRELSNGQMLIEFDLNGRYTVPFLEVIETLAEEEIRAEMELFDIHENLARDEAGIMQKIESANEFLIDGEVLALNARMFQKNFNLIQALKNPNIKQYTEVLNKLVARFPGVTWKWDTDLEQVGRVDFATGEIIVNPNLIKEDTPWHEFGHFAVRAIRKSNPELFEQLKKEIQKLHDESPTSSAYTFVQDIYPDYVGTDSFWEEAIVTELGRQATTKANRGLFDKIFDWFKSLLKSFNVGVSQVSNMSNLVDSLVDPANIFDVIPTNTAIADYMFQRIIPTELVDSLTQYVRTTPDAPFEFQNYADKIKTYAAAISDSEFKKILDTNKYLGYGSESLQRALSAIKEIKDIVTKEDVAASVMELADYMQYSSYYLTGLIRHIDNLVEDPDVPSGKKLGDIDRAHRQALSFEKHLQKFSQLISTQKATQMYREETSKNPFLKNFVTIELAINNIKKRYSELIIDPVLTELTDSLALQKIDLEQSFNDQIDKLKTRQQTPKIIQRIATLEKEKNESIPTRENIKRFISDGAWIAKNSSWFSSFNSAMSTKNPTIQMVSQYIRGINNEFQENLKPIAGDWQNLMDEVAAEEGGFLAAVMTPKEVFKNYLRETKSYEVIDGQLVKDKEVLSLNIKVKTVELLNRSTELNYLVEYGETQEIQNQAEEDLKKFYEDYTERPFTEEYYAIQKLLPDDIKKKRNNLYQEISAIREEFGVGEIDDNTIIQLKEKQKELDELERLYTPDGEFKTGKEYDDALAIQKWKENKRNLSVIGYVLGDDSKNVFEKVLADKKSKLAKGLMTIESYNNWAAVHTRTIYTQEFYDTRQEILDEINELLKDKGSINDLYSNLFNLLGGNKDKNGIYNPIDITEKQVIKSKELEEEIESIKAFLKKESPLDKNVKEKLSELIEELQELQSNVNSEYYTTAVETQVNTIRTRIETENLDLDQDSIEKLVTIAFKNSTWYKNNHIIKNRYDPDLNTTVEVMEPIFMWRVTRPNDLKYIEKDAPSFLWYKAVVNTEFKNPNYKPGEVTFKDVTGGEYYNEAYDNLSEKRRKLLDRMRDLHYQSQEGLYRKDKLGDLIPGMKKTRGEFIDQIKLKKNIVKTYFKNVTSYFSGDREAFSDEEDIFGAAYQVDAFGDPVTRESRRLFNRYARTLPLEEQSYDIMTAMASYATSSERFRVMRKYQSTVLTMENVVVGAAKESDSTKVIKDLIDRELYGKSLESDTPLKKVSNSIFSGISSFAGFKVLGFNLINLPQNWISGHLKIYSQLGFYHLTSKDLIKAHADTAGISQEFYLSYNQFGAKPYRLSLVDYCVGTQGIANQASELNNKGLAKYGKVLKTVATARDFTEFDIAAVTTYTFLNKYRVNKKNSSETVPLKDAFELKDGIIQVKDTVDVSPAFINKLRNNIQKANERAQGIYALSAQPTASKYAWFRSLLFLKKWVIPDLKSTWGGETIHYGEGIRTIGSHRAAIRFLKDFIYYDNGNMYQTWKYSADFEKAGLKQFAIQWSIFTILSNLLVQMSLRFKCEEDDVADWKDYVCLGLKRVLNEAEGVFTLWGLNEAIFTWVSEKANGVGFADKLFWNLLGPLSVFRKFFTDEDLRTTEPYYRYRSNSNKIDWDKTHPMQAGQPGLAVLAMDVLGLKGMFVGPKSIEFQNRAFNDYSPKTYTKELVTRYKKDHKGLEVMPTRTPLAQELKLFKKEIKELQRKASKYLERGEPIPLEIQEKALRLRDQFQKRVEKIKSGKDNSSTPIAYPFMNIFGDRKGLDITPNYEEPDEEPDEE